MQAESVKSLVMQTLEDHKAESIVTLNVAEMTSIADYLVVCTGRSSQHTQTLAQYLIESAKHNGCQPLGVEGEQHGDWILVDLGDVVVHIMQQETRDFYSLEKLWSVTEAMKVEGGEDSTQE